MAEVSVEFIKGEKYLTWYSDDFPDPLRPVSTTSLSLGMSTSTFFRLCSFAPLILIYCLESFSCGM